MLKRIANKVSQLLADAVYDRMPAPISQPSPADMSPPESAAVYWVGHSLMQEQADSDLGTVSLFIWLQEFARFCGLNYRMIDHTLWGAPLSLQWRGRVHSYQRTAPEMQELRANFSKNAARCSHFVFTEVVPLRKTRRLEYSAWYLYQFCRAALAANPGAQLYVYESWDYFQSGDASPFESQASWRQRMQEQRVLWEELVDAAGAGLVVKPTLGWQLARLMGRQADLPPLARPICLIPVGQVMLALHERLRHPRPGDDFSLADGEPFAFYQLFINPWLPQSLNVLSLRLANPDLLFDDIHAAEVGIYLVALVHFAVIYRRDPAGLPPTPMISEGFARTLQGMVWEVVRGDRRTGV